MIQSRNRHSTFELQRFPQESISENDQEAKNGGFRWVAELVRELSERSTFGNHRSKALKFSVRCLRNSWFQKFHTKELRLSAVQNPMIKFVEKESRYSWRKRCTCYFGNNIWDLIPKTTLFHWSMKLDSLSVESYDWVHFGTPLNSCTQLGRPLSEIRAVRNGKAMSRSHFWGCDR
jgi:hypothetical protein